MIFEGLESKDVDICMILEGTYPFVRGGVSNWVSELIRVFPQYRFGVIFLGTRAQDYAEPCYALSKNLVHLEMHYLFESKALPIGMNKNIDPHTLEAVSHMHDQMREYHTNSNVDISGLYEVFELLEDGGALNECLFLRSKAAWELITARYSELYPDQSFFDYFWSVRNLHRPFWPLKQIVNQIPKAKVLHSSSTGYAGFLGALLQKKYGLPYILTEHGLYTKERWIELMQHYFVDGDQRHTKPLEQEPMILNIWIHFFEILGKVAYTAANPIISLSQAHQDRQHADGAFIDKTSIISYGIDFDRFPFLAKKPPNAQTPIIACLGRVVPIKDIKTFIRSCALIIKAIPGAEAWIVGSVTEDPEYVSACEHLIAILGLEHQIKCLAEQPVMDIYQAIDLLVLTSISEGSPFVILESLAVGIPVVATDVGGCKALIQGLGVDDQALGAAGSLVSIANPSAVAEAAIRLLTDKQAWISAQQSGLARVRQYYSMAQFIDHYGSIYQEAITHGRNRISIS